MFIVPSTHWDEFLGYAKRVKLDDDKYYTADDVVSITSLLKKAIIPLKPNVTPDIYPSRQYFDLYNDFMHRVERKKSLNGYRPEMYLSAPDGPVSLPVYAQVFNPLYYRMDHLSKANGHVYLKNIFNLYMPVDMTDLIKLMYTLFRATDYYYSKITVGE